MSGTHYKGMSPANHVPLPTLNLSKADLCAPSHCYFQTKVLFTKYKKIIGFQATHTSGVRPQTVFGVRGVLPLPVVFHAVVEYGRVVGPLKDKHIMVEKSVKEGTPRRRVATNGNVRISCFKSNFVQNVQLLLKCFDQGRCSCPQGPIVNIYVYRYHIYVIWNCEI